MPTADIQERINALAAALAAKGLPQATAAFRINPHVDPNVSLHWAGRATSPYADKSEWFHGSVETALAAAEAHVAALPSPEQARINAFMSALSEAIELGKKTELDVEFVNPLLAIMQRISKNALKHQTAAA